MISAWKLVPVEPTPAMIRAMELEWLVGPAIDMAKREYAAMLAAAPQPAPATSVVPELVEALEVARNGLLWYRDRNPGQSDGSDDEAMAQIDAALARATDSQQAAPQKPKPLTADQVFVNNEIMAINAGLGLRIDQLMDLVRAVEQAHGISP